MIQIIAAAAAAGLLFGSLSTWYLTAEYKDATWGAATNQLKVDAAQLLQAETDKVLKTEREANTKVRELEAGHAQKEKDLAVIERRNRQLAAQLGGLRDPGRRPNSTNAVPGTPASPGSTELPAASGYLSAEASGFLLNAAAEVDALASYAKACYDWKEIVMHEFSRKEDQ
jgi:hypothetical protein